MNTRQTGKIELPAHYDQLLASADRERLIEQIRSLYHAWQLDVRELERYGQAVYDATGATISGGLDPTDPGPDPAEFDIEMIRQLGRDAARYRFLRDGLDHPSMQYISMYIGNQFDAAVDAAVAKGK